MTLQKRICNCGFKTVTIGEEDLDEGVMARLTSVGRGGYKAFNRVASFTHVSLSKGLAQLP